MPPFDETEIDIEEGVVLEGTKKEEA